MSKPRARAIAFYLPQFHPIPENDAWWGRGFTEWTLVERARPLFEGHYQPHVPADLGYYDLLLPEAREAQAALAAENGIEGFCYWHYWFAGKRLLERPFEEVLRAGTPRFPFCLAWANDSWSGSWYGNPEKLLMEQTYPGREDQERHFYALLDAFGDDRYITMDGRPVFLIYKPRLLPEPRATLDFWRDLAHKAGLKGLHLVAVLQAEPLWDPADRGFDAITVCNQTKIIYVMPPLPGTGNGQGPRVYDYRDALPLFIEDPPAGIPYYPCVVPNWDNTPRAGARGIVLSGSSPELFRLQVRQALARVRDRAFEDRLVFVKSWNEWSEGNHLEPDLAFGKGFLEALKQEILVEAA